MPFRELVLTGEAVETFPTSPFYSHLKFAGRRLLRSPIGRFLHPLARQAKSVSEPPGRVWLRARPREGLQVGQESLTILSANLLHGWPRFENLMDRLEAFVSLVERDKPDVVLLQEVARTPELRVDEWLSEQLGMAYVYSRANGHAEGIGFEEGLAVFSRYPLSEPRLVQLSQGRNPFVRRFALGARLHTPFGEVMAFSVHLGIPPRHNARQVDRLRVRVASLAGDRPAFVGGDFNSGESSPQMRRIRHHWLDTFRHLHPFADAATHEVRLLWGNLIHRIRLDYIFMRPGRLAWQVCEARVVLASGLPFSDHSAVLARLKPKP